VAALYYEAHITVEPVFDERRDLLASVAKEYGFKLADLLMKKREDDTETRSSKDSFLTGTDRVLTKLDLRMLYTMRALTSGGFKIWRYKIESIVMDSRCYDFYDILKLNTKAST
jgi:hypothetical protein